MEALRSIDQQQQAFTKHAQVLTYQAAGFSHVHKMHFDHYKQRVISIFRTANSSMKASERELGFKLSLMSSSTSLLCSLPRKWSYGQNKSLRMHKNIQELRNPTLCWQMPILSVRFQFLLPILPQPSQFLRPSASWTVSRKLIAVEIAPSTKSQIPSPDRTHQTSNLHALTHLGPAKALSLQSW